MPQKTLTLRDWNRWGFEDRNGWSEWCSLTAAKIEPLKAAPGAYVIGLPARGPKLGRLLAVDDHGLLDVGEAGDLRQRLRDFLRCASKAGEGGHMAGWRLGSLGLLRRLDIAADELRFSWCSAATKEEAYQKEGAVLRAYYELFGELPPLNYKFNWSVWEET